LLLAGHDERLVKTLARGLEQEQQRRRWREASAKEVQRWREGGGSPCNSLRKRSLSCAVSSLPCPFRGRRQRCRRPCSPPAAPCRCQPHSRPCSPGYRPTRPILTPLSPATSPSATS